MTLNLDCIRRDTVVLRRNGLIESSHIPASTVRSEVPSLKGLTGISFSPSPSIFSPKVGREV